MNVLTIFQIQRHFKSKIYIGVRRIFFLLRKKITFLRNEKITNIKIYE